MELELEGKMFCCIGIYILEKRASEPAMKALAEFQFKFSLSLSLSLSYAAVTKCRG